MSSAPLEMVLFSDTGLLKGSTGPRGPGLQPHWLYNLPGPPCPPFSLPFHPPWVLGFPPGRAGPGWGRGPIVADYFRWNRAPRALSLGALGNILAPVRLWGRHFLFQDEPHPWALGALLSAVCELFSSSLSESRSFL